MLKCKRCDSTNVSLIFNKRLVEVSARINSPGPTFAKLAEQGGLQGDFPFSEFAVDLTEEKKVGDIISKLTISDGDEARCRHCGNRGLISEEFVTADCCGCHREITQDNPIALCKKFKVICCTKCHDTSYCINCASDVNCPLRISIPDTKEKKRKDGSNGPRPFDISRIITRLEETSREPVEPESIQVIGDIPFPNSQQWRVESAPTTWTISYEEGFSTGGQENESDPFGGADLDFLDEEDEEEDYEEDESERESIFDYVGPERT